MGQEEEIKIREKVFPPYQVNQILVEEADPDVIVMHCLPAHRGQEITDEVADGTHSALFQQAHNRLHAQKSILARLFGVG
jgi:ornithine carbamoyltransferase